MSQYDFGSKIASIRFHKSVTNSEVSEVSFQIVSQPHSPLRMCISVSRTDPKLPPKSRVNCSLLSVEAACRTAWFAQRSYSNSSCTSSLFIAIADLPLTQSYTGPRFFERDRDAVRQPRASQTPSIQKTLKPRTPAPGRARCAAKGAPKCAFSPIGCCFYSTPFRKIPFAIRGTPSRDARTESC